jgi:2-(1,2-epoxy-1,2-dihydrophenyl)acetyl-CoA isomerase
MMYRFILLERAGAIARITLNRPERLNALTRDLLGELAAALDEVAADRALRACVLTGAGRGFSAGHDLTDTGVFETPAAARVAIERDYAPVVRKLTELEVPVLAAVNGIAAGAGCALALACDIVLAAASASFLMAFARIGLVPDAGSSWFLPRRVGHARAAGMALLADPVPAERAAEWGLIWQAVPDAEFPAAVEALARRLAQGPTRALGLAKRALAASASHTLEQQIALEGEMQALAAGTADFREGKAAFLEKRPASFIGS